MATQEVDPVVQLAHELLTQARDNGNNDATWNGIFEQLQKTPQAIVRPANRRMSLLHQAAFWGHAEAVRRLLQEFHVDATELTDEGKTALAVAEGRGHQQVVAMFRQGQTDGQVAHQLLDRAKTSGNEDEVWQAIYQTLRERPGAKMKPAVRAYSLLHQAAYWGHKAAVGTLVEEFDFDLREKSTDGENKEAVDVAEARKHTRLAEIIRLMLRGVTFANASVDVTDIPSLYAPDSVKDEDRLVDGDTDTVEVWLVLDTSNGPKWLSYTAKQNSLIAKARASGATEAKLPGGVKVHLADCFEEEEGSGKKRRMCHFRVQWEWDKGKGGIEKSDWTPYAAEDQFLLEEAMSLSNASCKLTVAGKPYVVDLVSFRQHLAEDSFRCRRIRRRGVPIREIFTTVYDVDTKKWLDLKNRPNYWQKPPAGTLEATFACRSVLQEGSKEWKAIAAWMNKTIETGHHTDHGRVRLADGKDAETLGMRVVKIEVIQQPRLWRRYCCYRSKMQHRAEEIKNHAGTKYVASAAMPKCEWLDQSINEAYFWHGSGKAKDPPHRDLIDAMVALDKQHCDTDMSDEACVMHCPDGPSARAAKSTGMFGAGVYLADLASKANLYVPCPACNGGVYGRPKCECTKKTVEATKQPYRMLLCRGVLGRMHIQSEWTKELFWGDFSPANKLNADSIMALPTGAEKFPKFREYILYNDCACYPEFVVHYWRSESKIAPS
mmetsp:Transcript_21870/g.49860  ORF Transcript_21870/g.49860 Transcript_21870/m.49860 type:complete len:718 (+) Transcript_21870:72-2225(+)